MIDRKALAIGLVLGAIHINCQELPQNKSDISCSFSEAHAKDGWAIPGLGGAKRQQRRAWNDNPGFFTTQLEPSKAKAFISSDVSCSNGYPGRLEIEKRPIRVVNLFSWDYEGHVFGYSVSYALQSIQHGIRTELAEVTTAQFFDIDGSGRFTLMRHPSDILKPFAPAMIPAWIQNQMKRDKDESSK